MALFIPFQGVRYRVGDAELREYVCGPYDVISRDERAALLVKNADNIVSVELPEGAESRYADSAARFAKMMASGLLMPDRNHCFYVYKMEFEDEGEPVSVEGVIGRLRLEAPEDGVVFPHENTYSGAKADRLSLMQAVTANISPVYALFGDEDRAVRLLIADAAQRPPAASVTVDSVKHSIYPVRGVKASQLTAAFTGKAIFIADGHHRYETALNYKAWREALGETVDDSHPANYIMTACVPLEQPGLRILPTHRVLSGFPGFGREKLFAASEEFFEITDTDKGSAKWALLDSHKARETSFLYYDGSFKLFRLKGGAELSALMPGKSDAYRRLGVSALHAIVIDRFFSPAYPDKTLEDALYYTRDFGEATALIDNGGACCAFLLNPTRVTEIADIALNGERMPQKSTYFYPKLITGLVINKM